MDFQALRVNCGQSSVHNLGENFFLFPTLVERKTLKHRINFARWYRIMSLDESFSYSRQYSFNVFNCSHNRTLKKIGRRVENDHGSFHLPVLHGCHFKFKTQKKGN